MTTPAGSGVTNKGTTYANGSQVTSTNLNDIVDDAVFNNNAVDDSTIGLNSSTPPALYVKALGIDTAQIATSAVETAKINNLAVTDAKIANDTITSNKLSFIEDSVSTASGKILVGDGTTYDAETMSGDATIASGGALTIANDAVTPAKTSFLGTVDTTADANVKILSKQADGEYDSVTPSGDVTMSQTGAFTIAADAVEGTMLNSNTVDDSTIELSSDTLSVKDSGITKAKIENVANMKVLGNTSGSATAPQEVTINDTDNMSDASDTTLATSESIKAYVDSIRPNIVAATKNTAETISFSSENETKDVADLEITITPRLASSTFIISGYLSAGFFDTNRDYGGIIQYKVNSGSYSAHNLPTSYDSRIPVHFKLLQVDDDGSDISPFAFTIPFSGLSYSVGNTLTFKLVVTNLNTTNNLYINRSEGDGDDDDNCRTISTIVVQEV